jgi:hypothetical protein
MVFTSRTLLATERLSREVIQVAKCTAKRTPASRQSFQGKIDCSVVGFALRAMGIRIRAASPVRQAALVKGGQSAKRMNSAPVETARIPRHKRGAVPAQCPLVFFASTGYL